MYFIYNFNILDYEQCKCIYIHINEHLSVIYRLKNYRTDWDAVITDMICNSEGLLLNILFRNALPKEGLT